MSRGDRQQAIYLDDADRQDFLKTLAEACQKTGFQVHAYCLMRNHFHLVVETPNANLVAGMRWLLSSYTIRLNHRHKLFGHVFSGRYQAVIVDGSGNGYLRTACDYVHLNPVRAKLLGAQERLLWVSVEQFGLVSGGTGTPARLDASGPFAGRARDCGGVETIEVERKRSQRAAEGRAGEAGDRGAIEAGDDPDDSGNSEALANGELEKSKQQAVFAQQDQAKGVVKVNSYGLTLRITLESKTEKHDCFETNGHH